MAAINSIDQVIAFGGDAVRWLFTWSWQALLLLGGAWVALKLDRSRSAAVRYKVWLIAIVAVAALPLLGALSHSLRLPAVITPPSFPLGYPDGAAAGVGIGEAAPRGFPWTSLVWAVLCGGWAAGVIFSLLRLGNSLRHLRRIRATARPVSITDLGCSYSDILSSGAGPVSIVLSEGIEAPGVAGLIRPVVLLPADIMSWTSPEERVSILRHELAHVRRCDHLISLLQSVLSAFLFFHPMLRYACGQLSLERELACDDQVLRLGTEPQAYAESILKAVERSFLTDAVHQASAFASRRKLERRIDMILDTNRVRQPMKQWRFLVLPVALVSVLTWLVIPAASGRPAAQDGNSGPVLGSSIPTPPAAVGQTSNVPVVNKATIWVDTVKRGDMVRQVRGLGFLLPDDSGRLKAAINIAEPQVKDVEPGQPAAVDIKGGDSPVPGKVAALSSAVLNGAVAVYVDLEGDLPASARTGSSIDGIIDIEVLKDIFYMGRPAQGQANSTVTLFKLEDDGQTAVRVQVKLGKASVNTIQIIDGLGVGDKVIISDMSAYDGVSTIRLQ